MVHVSHQGRPALWDGSRLEPVPPLPRLSDLSQKCLPLTLIENAATETPWYLEVGLKNSRGGFFLRSVQSFPSRDKRGCMHAEA
jgi:putative exosortase-associated protein (TIGR04073 family)